MLSEKEQKELLEFVDALRTMRKAIEVKASFALGHTLRVHAQKDSALRAYELADDSGKRYTTPALETFATLVQEVEEHYVGLALLDRSHTELCSAFATLVDELVSKLSEELREVGVL
jgi:lipopolysaccharide biosynthesis regulator YciM